MGRLPNEHQSQRALGIDHHSGTLALRLRDRCVRPRAARRAADTTAKADGTAGAPIALKKFAKPRARKQAAAPSSKSSKTAAKTTETRKPDDADASKDAAQHRSRRSVANANAQLPGGATAADDALKIAAAQADNALQSARQDDRPAHQPRGTDVVSADQLNDIDRALVDDKADPGHPGAGQHDPDRRTGQQRPFGLGIRPR